MSFDSQVRCEFHMLIDNDILNVQMQSLYLSYDYNWIIISNDYYKGIDFSQDKTRNILDTSIITHRDSWDKEVEKKLNTILKRYKEVNN